MCHSCSTPRHYHRPAARRCRAPPGALTRRTHSDTQNPDPQVVGPGFALLEIGGVDGTILEPTPPGNRARLVEPTTPTSLTFSVLRLGSMPGTDDRRSIGLGGSERARANRPGRPARLALPANLSRSGRVKSRAPSACASRWRGSPGLICDAMPRGSFSSSVKLEPAPRVSRLGPRSPPDPPMRRRVFFATVKHCANFAQWCLGPSRPGTTSGVE
jgi:hypothetical protein